MTTQKDLIAGLYDRVAAVYDQVGSKTAGRFGKRLVELMAIPAGAYVVDVGVGRGANLFPAAAAVGSEGRVIGIDISHGMLRAVSADINARGFAQIEVAQMDGEQLAFVDASFDHLLCGYTIFWFDDLQQALRGFHRVLKTAGSVGISMYGGGDPRWAWYGELLSEYGEQHVRFTDFGGNDVNGKPYALQTALRAAGFVDVQLVIESFEIVYTSADEWWEEKWTHGSRVPLEQMTPVVRDRFKREVFAKLSEMEEAGGFRVQLRTCFAIAHKRRLTSLAPDSL